MNSKLKIIYEICEKHGLDPSLLHTLFQTMNTLHPAFTAELLAGGWLYENSDLTIGLKEKTIVLLTEIDSVIKGKTAKPKKQPIVIDMEKVTEYREMWPNIKFNTGASARVNVRDLADGFRWYFANYPEHTWENILKATERYLLEYESKNWEFCSTSLYFIRKQQRDKSYISLLATWYDKHEEIPEQTGFDVKLY